MKLSRGDVVRVNHLAFVRDNRGAEFWVGKLAVVKAVGPNGLAVQRLLPSALPGFTLDLPWRAVEPIEGELDDAELRIVTVARLMGLDV